MIIFTVGYEGCDIDYFVSALKKNKIACIIDIRKNPVSRKKGFSKNKLRDALAHEGINYVHFGGLGVPQAWRKAEKAHEITRRKMFSDYVKKIIPVHEVDVEEVIKVARKEKRAALLCYEADASDCHRRYLAEEIKKHTKVTIQDLEIAQPKSLLPITLRNTRKVPPS